MKVIKQCGDGLFDALPALEAELSDDEFQKIKREIGRVIAVMDGSIVQSQRRSPLNIRNSHPKPYR
jgi:hypothetical protein